MKYFAALGSLGAIAATTVCLNPTGEPKPDPVFVLFDADKNGEISMDEAENATEILKARDVNGDGIIVREELPRPPRGRRGGREMASGRSEGQGERPGWDEQVDLTGLPEGTVVFQGGYNTDDRDGGRPVNLIAGALGVESQVFRDVFAGVNPSRGGPPSVSRARANKEVLMSGLGPHGVTNDRLDEVSNYYRYRPEAGESWPHRNALAEAVIEGGKVTEIRIVNHGHGYLVAPNVVVVGHEEQQFEVRIAFDTDFESNGRIETVAVK